MPDARLDRMRKTLPKGYQFPTPCHQHTIVRFDPVRCEFVCECGGRFDARMNRLIECREEIHAS